VTRPAPKPSSEPASTIDERSTDPCGPISPAWRRFLGVVLALTLVGSLVLGAADPEEPAIEEPEVEGPAIEGLTITRDNGDVTVSFEVVRGFTEEDLNRVHSGISLEFNHRAEIMGKRILGMFNRKMLSRTVMITTVQYDTLTRRYDLTREVRGKSWPKDAELPDRVDEATTTSVDEMQAWMTAIDGLPLPDPPDVAERVKVKVRSELGKKFVMMVFPSNYTVYAETWVDP
jgi:hypothetical protein